MEHLKGMGNHHWFELNFARAHLLGKGSVTKNVQRAILDQKNKKQICLDPQKIKSLIQALYEDNTGCKCILAILADI